jgi:hypothetical protein
MKRLYFEWQQLRQIAGRQKTVDLAEDISKDLHGSKYFSPGSHGGNSRVPDSLR